jgi:hypothetical protein
VRSRPWAGRPSADMQGIDPAGCLFGALADEGYTMIGPTIRDGVIVHAEFTVVGVCPRGGRTSRTPEATG